MSRHEKPAPPRASYHHGDLRETLIGLALVELEAQGADGSPEALSVAALAKRAGVSPMAPYRHFPDKQALLEALARRGFEELGRSMNGIDMSRPIEAIEAFGVLYVEFALARPGLFRLMFQGSPPTSDAEVLNDPSTVYGRFQKLVAAMVEPERLPDVALALWSLAHGLACLSLAGRIRGPAERPAERVRRIMSAFRKGLDGEETERGRD
jgi:AcrR family transcriptional regulator